MKRSWWEQLPRWAPEGDAGARWHQFEWNQGAPYPGELEYLDPRGYWADRVPRAP